MYDFDYIEFWEKFFYLNFDNLMVFDIGGVMELLDFVFFDV